MTVAQNNQGLAKDTTEDYNIFRKDTPLWHMHEALVESFTVFQNKRKGDASNE